MPKWLMNYFSLRFITHELVTLLQLTTQSYASMCKLTCYFIFLSHQEAACVRNLTLNFVQPGVLLPVTLKILNSVAVQSQGWNRTWRLWCRVVVERCSSLTLPGTAVPTCICRGGEKLSSFQLSSFLPLPCPPPAVLPLGSPCQGPLPKYLWFIFACQKVSMCPQDNRKALRSVAQSSLNNFWRSLCFWQEVLGSCRPTISNELQIGWIFAAFVAPLPRLYCTWTNLGFWKMFRM